METNFLKGGGKKCAKSVIAMATGTLYMLERGKCNQFSRKKAGIGSLFSPQINKYALDIYYMLCVSLSKSVAEP